MGNISLHLVSFFLALVGTGVGVGVEFDHWKQNPSEVRLKFIFI